MSGRPEMPTFSRCRTVRLPLIRRALATNGAEWSSSGVLRASRYCRELVWRHTDAWGVIDSSLKCERSITQASPSSSCVRRPASRVRPCACCWRYWDEWRIHSTRSYRTKQTLPERERNTLFIQDSISELTAVCSVFILQIMKGMQNTNTCRPPELPPAASVQKLMRGRKKCIYVLIYLWFNTMSAAMAK